MTETTLQVASGMGSCRSTKINRIRGAAVEVFGPDFKSEWFGQNFNRESVDKLQQLLGAQITAAGSKKYSPVPPILFPDVEKPDKDDVFLNPALINVSAVTCLLGIGSLHTNKSQVAKVALFGPASLRRKGKAATSGPKPDGITWKVTTASPGLIAFAAIVVSVPFPKTDFIPT
jgi:hypothetical protein